MKLEKYFLLLVALLLVKALGVVTIIQSASIGLGPDEAQYWTWSRLLDWGYYSKPPGIAWQIWLGTQFFGHTELGVRFFSIVIGFLQPLVLYALARQCKLSPKAAFWSGLLFALAPIGFIGSFLAITDGGMVFFWTLACLFALRDQPLLVGASILFGALFKWPIYLFWLFYLFIRPSRKLIPGMFLSLLGLLPSLWWNATHEWATFRHVSATIQGGHGQAGGNFFEFLGMQMLLITPPLFILLFSALRSNLNNPGLRFCRWITFSTLTVGLCHALIHKTQGNWVIFAYPTAMILLVSEIFEYGRSQFWMLTSVCFTAIIAIIPISNPTLLKHNSGWGNLAPALSTAGYLADDHFLVGDKYQTTSLLSFYAPEQKRAYQLNLHGARNNQFTYWPQLKDEYLGQQGYFVVFERNDAKKEQYRELLAPYFEQVRFVSFAPLVEKKGALIFYCDGVLDVTPTQSDLY